MRPTGTMAVIRITGRSSRVDVTGVADAAVEVHGGTATTNDDGSIDIVAGSGRLRVTCPERSTVVVSTASGTVVAGGSIAELRALTSSGRVEIASAAEVDVRTRSGAVVVGTCSGVCRVTTSSGSVRVEEAREVTASSTSTKVVLGRVSVANVRTVSGTIEVGLDIGGRVDASSVSGKVRVRVPAGTAAKMRLTSRSGRITRDVPELDEGSVGCTVDASTSSGTIEVRQA